MNKIYELLQGHVSPDSSYINYEIHSLYSSRFLAETEELKRNTKMEDFIAKSSHPHRVDRMYYRVEEYDLDTGEMI